MTLSAAGFNNRSNNNNNNNNAGGPDLFGPGPGGFPPTIPTLDDFSDNDPQPPPFRSSNNTTLNTNLFPPSAGVDQPLTSNFDVENFTVPSIETRGIGNDIFGSQAASTIRENKTKTQAEIDDFLYELPENEMPELALGDGLIRSLGVETEDLLDENTPSTKKEEEEDEVLKNLMDEYQFENIKDSMDETGQVPESTFFFMVERAKHLLMHLNS